MTERPGHHGRVSPRGPSVLRMLAALVRSQTHAREEVDVGVTRLAVI